MSQYAAPIEGAGLMSDIEITKNQINAQLDDYERAIEEYRVFMEWWRARQPTRMFTDELDQPQPAEAAE